MKPENNFKILSFSQGFTLLELLTVIFILSISLGAMALTTTKVINYSNYNKSKLIAVYLAQEGVELVRNLRDSNWIQGNDWLESFPTCPSSNPSQWCEIDYNDSNLIINDRFLKLDSATGVYSYDSGIETQFKRKIYLDPLDPTPTSIRVTVKVVWQDNLGEHQYELKEKLYDWK